jgi:hypothetical protein
VRSEKKNLMATESTEEHGKIKEPLINSSSVIPAYAGIQ